MKKIPIILFLLIYALPAFGQNKVFAPVNSEMERSSFAEAKEAFKDFDFARLSINPNNLTEENIKDLRNTFFLKLSRI